MEKIYLVRHCKAEGQLPDAHLTEQGREDAERVILDFFKEKTVDLIVSSPYLRAIDTIKPLSRSTGKKIQIDERLKERVLSSADLDDWLTKLEDTYIDLNLKFEGGESSNEAMSRGIEVINELISTPGSTAVVVTHGALLSLIIKHYNHELGFKEWKSMNNPDVYCIEVNHKEISVHHVWMEVPQNFQ